jgi:hypothetical protein
MNDQPTPDALSRASAYLDGELDAAEIAAAEADPAVMAEVAQLRSLQEAVRAVGEPTSSARDGAIAAALAEYDRKRHPAPVIRSRPRPAYTRWLAVAAAVAGLAALGAVIATNSRGGDDNDAAGALASDQFASSEEASSASARVATDGGGAPAAPQPEAATQSQSAEAVGATEAPAASLYAAADSAAEAPATTLAAAGVASSPPPFDPNTPIPNELELGRVGRQLLAEWEDGSRDSKTGTPCDASIPDAVLLSDALLIVDGTARPVLVAGNRETRETFALDPTTCVIIATGQ